MDKPTGKWKCRVCGEIQDGQSLYQDPSGTAVKWTCSNLSCGGTCDKVKEKPVEWTAEEILKREG